MEWNKHLQKIAAKTEHKVKKTYKWKNGKNIDTWKIVKTLTSLATQKSIFHYNYKKYNIRIVIISSSTEIKMKTCPRKDNTRTAQFVWVIKMYNGSFAKLFTSYSQRHSEPKFHLMRVHVKSLFLNSKNKLNKSNNMAGN